MSEVITLTTGETETILGTYALAKSYLGMQRFADPYKTWIAAVADDQKGTLGAAVRYLNAQVWGSTANTFALRDAIAAFPNAQYELAAMLYADPTLLTLANQGSNIQSVSASGASVSYFNSTMRNAALLPPILMRLVGSYLGASGSAGPQFGAAAAGSDTSPAAATSTFARWWPY